MKNVIQIINHGNKLYYVSHNPNNGNLTVTNDISQAAVFESDLDKSLIPAITKIIMYQYPVAKIIIMDIEPAHPSEKTFYDTSSKKIIRTKNIFQRKGA